MFQWLNELLWRVLGTPHVIRIESSPKPTLGFKARDNWTFDWFIVGAVVIFAACIFMILNYSGVKLNLNFSQPKSVATPQTMSGKKGFVPIKEPRLPSETQMGPHIKFRTVWGFNDQKWNERSVDGYTKVGESKNCNFTDPVFEIPANSSRDALILYEGSAGGIMSSDDIVNVQGKVVWEYVNGTVISTVRGCGPAFTKFSLWVR